MSAYEELLRHHLRSVLDLIASMPASEYLDSTETLDMELRATAFRHHDPEKNDLTCTHCTTILAL
jgi:hypothetical protein